MAEGAKKKYDPSQHMVKQGSKTLPNVAGAYTGEFHRGVGKADRPMPLSRVREIFSPGRHQYVGPLRNPTPDLADGGPAPTALPAVQSSARVRPLSSGASLPQYDGTIAVRQMPSDATVPDYSAAQRPITPVAAAPMSRAMPASVPASGDVFVDRSPGMAMPGTMQQKLAAGSFRTMGLGSSTPAPADVLAARQRIAAERLGGMPLSQARAMSEGRQDAATRIANARGKANIPSYPSPLDGTAAQFKAMSASAAAREAAADTAWNQNMENYRARRDRDDNNNGIPDRDEAIASKFGKAGITTKADFDTAHAKYMNYLRSYRNSGAAGSARAMNFDEFASALQEERKSLPVFGLDGTVPTPDGQAAPRSVAQAPAAAPAPQAPSPRVQAAVEQRRARELAVLGMNNGMNPVQAQQFALSTLSNERQARYLADQAEAQRMGEESRLRIQNQGQMDIVNAQTGAERARLDAQLEAQRLAQEERMAQGQQQFDLQIEQARAANRLAEDRLGLDRDRMEREQTMEDIAIAGELKDPELAYNEAYRASTARYQQLYPYDPTEVDRLARQDAELVRMGAARRRDMARRAGIDVGEDMAPQEPLTFRPPRPTVDMNDGSRPAVAEDIVNLYQRIALDTGTPPTREELMRQARESGLLITPQTEQDLYNRAVATQNARSFPYFSMFGSELTDSDRVYEAIYGETPVTNVPLLGPRANFLRLTPLGTDPAYKRNPLFNYGPRSIRSSP